MAMLPNHRHHDAFSPGCVLARERRSGEHFDRRINMQIILFGPIWKILYALHNWIIGLCNIDGIVDIVVVFGVAWMAHPLPSAHELVIDSFAKGVTHPAVIATEAHSAFHRLA